VWPGLLTCYVPAKLVLMQPCCARRLGLCCTSYVVTLLLRCLALLSLSTVALKRILPAVLYI
jgi:hypothetical protein